MPHERNSFPKNKQQYQRLIEYLIGKFKNHDGPLTRMSKEDALVCARESAIVLKSHPSSDMVSAIKKVLNTGTDEQWTKINADMASVRADPNVVVLPFDPYEAETFIKVQAAFETLTPAYSKINSISWYKERIFESTKIDVTRVLSVLTGLFHKKLIAVAIHAVRFYADLTETVLQPDDLRVTTFYIYGLAIKDLVSSGTTHLFAKFYPNVLASYDWKKPVYGTLND